MRIVQVIAGVAKAAGTSVFCCELANGLVERGHEVTIAVINPGSEDQCSLDAKVRVITMASLLSDLQGNPECSFDVVHIHALWGPILTKIAKAAHKRGIRVVWSPHGMLTPWALKNHWPKKVLGLLAYQYWALRRADLIHATADSEVDDVRRLHLKNPIVVAPLGAHLEKKKIGGENRRTAEGKYICFVSRIQRKKGLPNLIRAWAQLPSELKQGWQIKIAGPNEDNHLEELYALCDELKIPYAPAPINNKTNKSTVHLHLPPPHPPSLSPEISFLGPIYDQAKDDLYANAAVSVLPTHSENFGSVVIESLAQRTPVICTKGAPWRDLVDHKCGWWIDIGVEPLVKALTEAMEFFDKQPSMLEDMGKNGYELVTNKYTWEAVAKTMEEAYAKLLR